MCEILAEFDSNICLRQGFTLLPPLLNIFIEGVLSKLFEPNTHFKVMLKR
jgi:hypothetical protein